MGSASAGDRTSNAIPRVSTVIAKSKNWQQSCSAAVSRISSSNGVAAPNTTRTPQSIDSRRVTWASNARHSSSRPPIDSGPSVHAIAGTVADGCVLAAERDRLWTDVACRRVGEAAAAVVAWPVWSVQFEGRRGALQLGTERHQFDNLALGGLEFVGNDRAQPILYRSASSTFPRRGQVGDLVETAAELLRPGNERQSRQRGIVEDAVPGSGARRRAAGARSLRSSAGSQR